jgi:hypothetical protein
VAATRSNSGTKTRQKVRLRRNIGEFDGKSLPNMARQVKEAFDMLLAALNGDSEALAALGIVNGNATPSKLLPQRPELEFRGPGVEMSLTKQRYVAVFSGGVTDHGALTGLADNDHTQYVNAAAGLDGIDSALAGQTITTRASRDIVSVSPSGVLIDWVPDAASATCDILMMNVTSFTAIRGMLAPGANDTILQMWWNDGNTAASIDHNQPSNANATSRILCPNGTTYTLRPNSGVYALFDRKISRWRLLDRDWTPDIPSAGVTDHGALTGLGDDDHTQYIRVDGTRAFTGDQSMGNNNLTNINQAVMTGASSQLVMSGGDIVQVDDITANGSGSVWNLVGGDITNVDDMTMGGATSTISDVGTLSMTSGGGTINNVLSLSMSPVGEVDMNGGFLGRILYADWDSSTGGVGTPGTGYDRMGMEFGIPFVVPYGLVHLDAMPIVAQAGTSDGATDVDVAVSLSNIRGIDMRGGAFSVECKAYACDNVDPGAGKEGHVIRCEYLFTRDDLTNTWNRATLYELEAGRGLASLLIQPLMTSDTVLTVSINLSALDNGDRYYAVAKISGRGRGA